MPELILKPGREKSLLRRHPWVFSGAIESLRGAPSQGETVKIFTAKGDFLSWASFSPFSQIRARVWSWDEGEVIGVEYFHRVLKSALQKRDVLLQSQTTNAVRLVHGESDGLPGLILDLYNDTLVVQFLSSGAEFWREQFVQLIAELSGEKAIYERSDADVRKLEGLPQRTGLLHGAAISASVDIMEHGLQYRVNIIGGQKTGFYLDQRDNRLVVRGLAKGSDVLDCFCYTGGFTLNAMAGGAASVLGLDSSGEALQAARVNVNANHFQDCCVEYLEGDAFAQLRKFRDAGRTFDLVILDPPKFAPTVAQAERAARGYKDINMLALKLLRPSGHLVTFSCSGGVSAELFQSIVAGAALDAGVEAQIVGQLHQASDHPIRLTFPEGAYLKGLVIQV